MILDQLYPRGISESRQRKLIEAQLLEDPVYRSWQRVGQLLVEKKLTEPEILDIFKRIETGQTAAGGNRTIAGRAKDTTVNAASAVKNAVTGVLNSIQTSAPVAAVDVAYDKATDALANLTGGQKGAAMEAIKKYRMLAKEYPKTAGFAKAALVAIAGLATGGAGLPAIAGLTYALDSAIRGDKLSSVLGKGAGASALAWAGQQAAGMIGNQPGADNVAAPTDTGAPATDAVPSRFDEISGISFLPWDGGTYRQAPYEECTKEQYEELLAKMPTSIAWDDLKEEDDNVEGAQTLACVAGHCEI